MDTSSSKNRSAPTMVTWLLVAVLGSLAASPVLAADWYASPGGSDSSSCASAATSCKTIQAAIDKAGENDTVHVAAGNYTFTSNRVHIDKAGLTLVGDHSPFDAASVPGANIKAADASVLKAATSNATPNAMIWVDDVANVTIRNLYIERGSRSNEAITAVGYVDGLIIDNNYVKVTGSTGGLAVSVNVAFNSNDTSVPSDHARRSGQFVTISNNVVEPTLNGFSSTASKRAIAIQNTVGSITGNQVAATTQDMWISSPHATAANPDAKRTLTISGNYFYGRLQLYLASGSGLYSTEIVSNHFVKPGSVFASPESTKVAGYLGNGSESHSVRVMGPNGGSPTFISNNIFEGFSGSYRALWIMNRAKVTVQNNTFTPDDGVADYTAILVGNREVWNGLPAPKPYGVSILGNTFNSSNGGSASNKGKAILFVNDNDQNGAATGGPLAIGDGTAAGANHFAPDIGWYVALDDRSCTGQNHNGGGSCNGKSGYPIGEGIAYSSGSTASSQKRPFRWDVNAAAQNDFGGISWSQMTAGQKQAVEDRIYDQLDTSLNPPTGLGLVVFPNVITTGTIDFTPTAFTYDDQAHAITAILQEDASAICTVTPATVTNAGDTVVSAHCISDDYDVTDTATISVARAGGTVEWDQLSFTYDTATHSVTAHIAEEPSTSCAVTPASVGPDAGSYTVTATCTGINYDAGSTDTTTIDPAAAMLTLSDLTRVYDGSPKPVTVTSNPTGVTFSVTYDGDSTVPTDAGSYAVVATVSDPNYTGSANGTLTIGKATGTVTWDQLSFTYDGSAHAVTAHIAEEPSTSCTVTPATVGPDAGSYAVSTSCAGGNYDISGTNTATIDPATATLALSDLTQVYDGSPKPVTVTSAPAGVTHSVTYDGSSTAPSAVGDYAVVGTITDSNYTGDQASGVLYIVEPAAPDVAVSITDNRDYIQFGHVLSYEIVVTNMGNTDLSGVTVNNVLPVTLLPLQPVSWHCYPGSGVGGTCAVTSGSGDLATSADIPENGSVRIVLDTSVSDVQSLTADVIENSVTVLAAGDTNIANDTATDTTQAVIFRDGFELNSDGAQVPMLTIVSDSLASLDGSNSQVLDLRAASVGSDGIVELARLRAGNNDQLQVQALRIDRQLQIRLVGQVNGTSQVSAWTMVDPATDKLALALASNGDQRTLLLVGGAQDLQLQLSDDTSTLLVWGAPTADK